MNLYNCRDDEDGEVKLEDVWFAYPSRPKDLVLKVKLYFNMYLSGWKFVIFQDCTTKSENRL